MSDAGVIHCLGHKSTRLRPLGDEWLECPICARRYPVLAGIPVVTDDAGLLAAGHRTSRRIAAAGAFASVEVPRPQPRFERTRYAVALPEMARVALRILKAGGKGMMKDLLGRPRRDDWTSIEYGIELAQAGDDGRQMFLGLDEGGPFRWNAWYSRVEVAKEIATCAREGGARRICEIGCGVGLALVTLLQRHGDQLRDVPLWATDISLSRAHITAARLAKVHSAFTVWNGDAAELPFPDDFFDLIWSVHVLEQMASAHARRAFEEMLRVSRRLLLLEPLYDAQSLWGKAYIRSMSYSRFVPRLPADRYVVERTVRHMDFKNETAVVRVAKR